MEATQFAMIQAAASIAALMPAKPAATLLGNRKESLVYHVYEQAAKAAYRRAAQECFNRAFSAQGDVNYQATHEMIRDESVSMEDLIAMCEIGFVWGGLTVTV